MKPARSHWQLHCDRRPPRHRQGRTAIAQTRTSLVRCLHPVRRWSPLHDPPHRGPVVAKVSDRRRGRAVAVPRTHFSVHSSAFDGSTRASPRREDLVSYGQRALSSGADNVHRARNGRWSRRTFTLRGDLAFDASRPTRAGSTCPVIHSTGSVPLSRRATTSTGKASTPIRPPARWATFWRVPAPLSAPMDESHTRCRRRR